MNARQKAFCNYYLETLNATESAKRAGYSEKTAYSMGQENLTKPELKTYIDKRLAEMEAEQVAGATEVMKYLSAVMRGEHTEQVLQLVGEGVQTLTDKEVGAKERIKAAELLGKRYSLFTDKVNLEGAAKVVIVDDLNE